MVLEDVSRRDFGNWYRRLVTSILYKLETPKSDIPSLRDLERILESSLSKFRTMFILDDKKILSQHKMTVNLKPKNYQRVTRYKLPAYILKKPLTLNSFGQMIPARHVPFIISTKNSNKENVFHHETQHVVFSLLTQKYVVPLDDGLSISDRTDFWMYKNELLSKLIGHQTPIGYTLNVLLKTEEEESSYIKQYSVMMSDVFRYIIDSAKNLNILPDEFIKPTFVAKNFSELFYTSVALVKGGTITEKKFNNIFFPSKKEQEYFLDHVSVLSK